MLSRQADYNRFRMMYPEFIYESYAYDVQPDGLHIVFSFKIKHALSYKIKHPTDRTRSLLFEPTAFIPARPFLDFAALTPDTLDTLVFNIGMIELVSYWKCYCPPTVTVKPFRMDERQAAFWKKVFFNGLGEFFYTNGIDATEDDFMRIVSHPRAATYHPAQLTPVSQNADAHIVPIGGGKDSVVSLELLKGMCRQHAAGKENTLVRPLIMNPRGATVACIERAGYSLDEVIVIKRDIHPLLLEQNSLGALNGHTPFSAMLAFYTLLASALTGTHFRIALSNEDSANESTVAGKRVNHQYSKSVEFEDDFRRYVGKYVCQGIDYYSFLRPLSELQIAMLFARFSQYHDIFRSCNVGSKEDIWCGHCAKCLFAYIILSPFIEPERLDAIFGKNMLDDESLRMEFDQLRGAAPTKPFECVGTVSEVNSALSMTIARWYPGERPSLLRGYDPRPVEVSLDRMNLRNNLPGDEFLTISDALRSLSPDAESYSLPYRYDELFNLLAFKRILVAGYGREGKSSEKLLRWLFPRGENFDIARDNDEIKASLADRRYDLILKSPGIPTSFFDGLCDPTLISSQADIFLRAYSDQTIGITGTKGKSTTATLMHHILQQCLGGKRRRFLLAGNIGIPLFDIIPQLDPDTTVVAELSCHQLENIRQAPYISVLLNLYQEHLDHYRSYDDYKLAKMQIALRQSPNDYFIYCSDSDDLREMVETHEPELTQTVKAYSLDEAKHSFLRGCSCPLPGDHNLSNIYAVHWVTGLLGVLYTPFLEALATFKGLEHRLEKVATKGGITYYNDSISTIPQTTIAAIEALKEVHALILGGMDRGIDYSPLVDYLESSPLGKQIKCIVLLGSAGERILELVDEHRPHLLRSYMTHFGSDYSMEEAVAFVAEHARPGGICLLSPAASSYDHYKNFEERGRDFKRIVNNEQD